jgi:hypothetical protein
MTGRRRRRPAHSATGRRSRLLGQRRAVPRQAAWPPAQMGAGRPWVARPCRLRTSRARRPGAAVAGRRRSQTVLTVAIRLGARSRRSRLLGLHPSDDQYQSDQTPARHPSGPASDPGDLRYSWTWKCPTQRRVRVHVESPRSRPPPPAHLDRPRVRSSRGGLHPKVTAALPACTPTCRSPQARGLAGAPLTAANVSIRRVMTRRIASV